MKAKTRNTIFISLGLLAGGSLFWFWWGSKKAEDGSYNSYSRLGEDIARADREAAEHEGAEHLRGFGDGNYTRW